MRSIVLSALVALALPALAQAAPSAPVPGAKPPRMAVQVREEPPKPGPCCVRKVWDAHGHEIGDLIDYDNRYGPQPLIGFVAYRIKGGDAVTLQVTPEIINSLQGAASMSTLFTTPDCSGNSMFAMLSWPPLAKRYAMVLISGWPPMTGATHAWLWVTGPLPVRAFPPAGTVFHSQWDNFACQPIAAPGFTVNPASGVGGYEMHRVEDLMAKYTRPFYINY